MSLKLQLSYWSAFLQLTPDIVFSISNICVRDSQDIGRNAPGVIVAMKMRCKFTIIYKLHPPQLVEECVRGIASNKAVYRQRLLATVDEANQSEEPVRKLKRTSKLQAAASGPPLDPLSTYIRIKGTSPEMLPAPVSMQGRGIIKLQINHLKQIKCLEFITKLEQTGETVDL